MRVIIGPTSWFSNISLRNKPYWLKRHSINTAIIIFLEKKSQFLVTNQCISYKIGQHLFVTIKESIIRDSSWAISSNSNLHHIIKDILCKMLKRSFKEQSGTMLFPRQHQSVWGAAELAKLLVMYSLELWRLFPICQSLRKICWNWTKGIKNLTWRKCIHHAPGEREKWLESTSIRGMQHRMLHHFFWDAFTQREETKSKNVCHHNVLYFLGRRKENGGVLQELWACEPKS